MIFVFTLMSDIAIKVENLSKRYRIGLKEELHDTLSGSIVSWIKSPHANFQRLKKLSSFTDENAEDIIWALKDVSFEVNKGEVVGIIGGNGAGKSTLLKILSRITEPTTGKAIINGRVASLLEVGTGFHNELTGRENIYLNGTILGMTRQEIDKQFDEIIAFAEVEKYIDTPVKRYSSGMKVRLAFSVAAHLEPEILLVDEVLAVGDAGFQKKCLGKMEDVAHEGRTVLFVSHNMSAIHELCIRGIFIDTGYLRFDGKVNEAIGDYLRVINRKPIIKDQISIIAVGPITVTGIKESIIESGKSFKAKIPLRIKQAQNAIFFYIIEDVSGNQLIHEKISAEGITSELVNGNYILTVDIPPLWLSPGVYSSYFKILVNGRGIKKSRIISERILFKVISSSTSRLPKDNNENKSLSLLSPDIRWSLEIN